MTALERLRDTGIRRVRAGKGFSFRTARGSPVAARELPRIRKLAIPPAWTEVRVAPSPSAKLQAIGKDKAGRWQYRYHPRFRARQDRQKFRKLVDFADALPRMRRRVARDIRSRGLGQDKVMACAIRVLSTCFMRPGSDEYARRHRHYGLTTIRRQHVAVKGELVAFDYPGKSGQRQHAEIRDRSVARIVRQMQKLPGAELFKFLAGDGSVVDLKREHLNDYIKGVMGPDFTAKDFRTWAGTLICACALARVAENDPQLIADASTSRRKQARPSKSAVRKRVVEAVKETAAELGNTPAVARNSYIEPSVLSSFEKGEVVEKYFDTVAELVEHEKPTLAEPEKALKELLEESAEPA